MQYRSLGRSGLKVSAVGLGTNQFGNKVDLETTQRILDGALELGVNLLDTADVYASGRSEEFIGKAIRDRRDQFVIATKVRHKMGDGPNDTGASRQHIMQGIEASLRRLQTDTIDIYQIHGWDDSTPIDETMRALDDLLQAGKVRYIGASNFAPPTTSTWADTTVQSKTSWSTPTLITSLAGMALGGLDQRCI